MLEYKLKSNSNLVVISAPSGGGKSTIIRALLEERENLTYVISATTRERREGEVDGHDYHFLALERFKELIKDDQFYEYAEVHGNYYGTLKSEVDDKLKAGSDVILDLDVQGAIQFKSRMPSAVSIFVLPPSMQVLEDRLRGRAKDKEEVIQKRLQNAKGEVKYAPDYDYTVVNENLDETIRTIGMIIDSLKFQSNRCSITDQYGNTVFPSKKKSSI